MASGAQLGALLRDLRGSLKTRQQARSYVSPAIFPPLNYFSLYFLKKGAVTQLISLLADQTEPIATLFKDKSQSSSPQNGDEPNDGASAVIDSSSSLIRYSALNGWNGLFQILCTHFTSVVKDSEGKTAAYDKAALIPCLDALVALSAAIKRHGVFLSSAAVDSLLEMIARTAAVAHAKAIFGKISVVHQNIVSQFEGQGLIASAAKSRLAISALLQILESFEQTRAGFQKPSALVRMIIESTNPHHFFGGNNKDKARELLITAAARLLSASGTDAVSAREILDAIIHLLKRYLLNDARLAASIVAPLNSLLTDRLDSRTNSALLKTIIHCFQLQCRIFVGLDGELLPIPSFSNLGLAMRSLVSALPASRTRSYFHINPTDRLMRMDNDSWRISDLMADVVLRLHLTGAPWPDETHQGSAPEGEPALKKRKLAADSSAVDSLVHVLLHQRDSDIVAWIKVFLVFISKYPKFLSVAAVQQLLPSFRERLARLVSFREIDRFCFSSG